MTKEQRKGVYDRLVKEGKLSRDDGALVREFGAPKDYKDIDEEFVMPGEAKPAEEVEKESAEVEKAAKAAAAAEKKLKKAKEEAAEAKKKEEEVEATI